MRSTLLLFAGVVATAITGCGNPIKVRTTVEPGANLAGLHTFYVLTPPGRSADATPLSADDPMLNNSITNDRLRADLAQAFQSQGYVPARRDGADFLVAYYAGTREKFDPTYWGPAYDPGWRYSYWGRRDWAWPYDGGAYPWGVSVDEYTQGQLIVDVTDPRTNQLLWRGQAVAHVSHNPDKYHDELIKAVNKIVAKFPQATVQATAATGR
jgi:hypothetical protein